MDKLPFISVVTVCFNAQDTIADTMRSVAAQTANDYEHVIVDGGSTDNTLSIVSDLSTERTRILSGPDRGLYDAMNKGIGTARGSVIGFLNADDFYNSPADLSAVIDRFRMTSADVVYGDIVFVDRLDATRITRRWNSGPFQGRKLRLGWHPPHPAFFARRELLQAVGSFALDLPIAADYELMLKALTTPAVRVEYLPRSIVRMRRGGSSTDGLWSYTKSNWQSYLAMRRNGLRFPALTVALKPLRKIHQFVPNLWKH